MKERPALTCRSQLVALQSPRALRSRVSGRKYRESLRQLWRWLEHVRKHKLYKKYFSYGDYGDEAYFEDGEHDSDYFGSDEDDEDDEDDESQGDENLSASESASESSEHESNEKESEIRDFEEICRICQLPYGLEPTSIQELISGASAGRQCCTTILDAIQTWHKSLARKALSLRGLRLDDAKIRIASGFHHSGVIYLDWSAMVDGVSICLLQPKDSLPHETDIASIYKFPILPPITSDTFSSASAQRLARWLHECTHNHPMCRKELSDAVQHYMPNRVLEIEGHQIVLREDLKSKSPYVCLSHCWGPKGVSFKLESSTIEVMRDGVSISALPKTFRDAVLVCLRLGLRFIWIDALCIIQDSKTDWEQAAASMADIYENGLLTIAATASEDSDGGCFSDRGNAFWPRQMSSSILHVAQYRHVWVLDDDHMNNFGTCPLLRRAWVFQERRLSVRIVHFAELQMIWECCSTWKSESGHIDHDWTNDEGLSPFLQTRSIPFKMPIVNATQDWQAIVVKYSPLQLTYVEDRLPALAAIVKRRMRSRPGDKYIAGLWRDSLLENLLWLSTAPQRCRPAINMPTWSWASTTGAVDFVSHVVMHASVEDMKYTHVGPPQLGNVVNASIVLRGHCLRGLLDDTSGINVCDLSEMATLKHLGRISSLFHPDHDFDTEPETLPTTDEVLLLFMGNQRDYGRMTCIFLALRQVSPDEHERIGVYKMRPDLLPWIDGRVRRKAKPTDNVYFRLWRQSVADMPVRQFKII
ncbi:heterokaryon incompatibility protein-domain-containing protein [Boeremia exigua]|uniref:heterokaryon incompatibility protein-domain-containing protein n=1 Tax=Boeremia exigua TaxID=749465 RepID=UPI001E8EB03E|nr:heterokaryon incompatibility protein-domain-containing protein [Boeremia exigua]KAH6644466.1 heterokaryon incompatibility protein-domain-containing protein [Boeremia exigua]